MNCFNFASGIAPSTSARFTTSAMSAYDASLRAEISSSETLGHSWGMYRPPSGARPARSTSVYENVFFSLSRVLTSFMRLLQDGSYPIENLRALFEINVLCWKVDM